jgi:hypothetical protein
VSAAFAGASADAAAPAVGSMAGSVDGSGDAAGADGEDAGDTGAVAACDTALLPSPKAGWGVFANKSRPNPL